MQIIADLQLHSPHARAVSKNITLEGLYDWAQKKGIGLITPADWTHPVWFNEIKAKLEELDEGVYGLKTRPKEGPKFLLVTEVSCVFYQDGRYHGIHILVFSPNLRICEKINEALKKKGQNLLSDGRPILNLNCRDLAATILEVDERCLLIPAHAWTPWFGFYGAHGGFDSLDTAFKDYAKYIYAIETGLGSDPAMNWRIGELDQRNIVSFSDAHSLPKVGREATVFELEKLAYSNIQDAIIKRSPKNKNSIAKTIEFYRQEGKYHFTGHRKCGVSFSPDETKKLRIICPVCGKKLTVGAMQRTEDLSARIEDSEYKQDKMGVRWVYSKGQKWRPPFVNLVPLQEIISEVFKTGVQSKKVQAEYERLISSIAPEFNLLLEVDLKEIERVGETRLREAIEKVRAGNIFVKPGYDGVFGVVKIWPTQEDSEKVAIHRQQGLF